MPSQPPTVTGLRLKATLVPADGIAPQSDMGIPARPGIILGHGKNSMKLRPVSASISVTPGRPPIAAAVGRKTGAR